MPEKFECERWDIETLINQADGEKDLPADRLFALVLLWTGRVNDMREHDLQDRQEWGLAEGYENACQDLISALDVIYPGWREQGMEKLIPKFNVMEG